MAISVLYPSDPLGTGQVDGHFRTEADAVRGAGGATPLVDLDALLAGDVAAAVQRVPAGSGALWYRGWMMPSARYARLAEALEHRDARSSRSMEVPASPVPLKRGCGGWMVRRSSWVPPRHAGRAPAA